ASVRACAWSSPTSRRACRCRSGRSTRPRMRASPRGAIRNQVLVISSRQLSPWVERGHIAPAFEVLKGRADALYVCIDPLVNTHRIRINPVPLAARLPTTHGSREGVEAAGLMSYGATPPDLFRRAADSQDTARGKASRY